MGTDDEAYRAKMQALEDERQDAHLSIAEDLVGAALDRIRTARGDVRFRRSHHFAAESHLHAAIAVLDRGR
jgi:aryl carrier-like protein